MHRILMFDTTDNAQASISAPGDGGVVAKAVLNTLVACCTAGTVVLFVNKALPGGKWSIVKLINGCLAGMESSHLGNFDFFKMVYDTM